MGFFAVVTFAALIGVLFADAYVERSERPIALLADMQHSLDDEARLELIINFDGRIQPSDIATLQADGQTIADTSAQLQPLAGNPLLQATLNSAARYQQDLHTEVALSEQGLYDLALQKSASLVQPDRTSLLDDMERSLRQLESDAQFANFIGTLISIIIIALAGFSCAVMVWLGWRRREQSRRAEAAAVQRSEARFRALLQSSFDVITVVADDGEIQWCSDAVQRLFGYPADEMVGRNVAEWIHPDDLMKGLWFNAITGASDGPEAPQVVECRVQHRNGRWRWVGMAMNSLHSHPEIQGTVLNLRDITERKSLETQLAHQALHDPLTGLGNRALLRAQLDDLLAQRAPGEPVSVLFIDLDGFKAVNDGMGHSAGDQLLVQVGHVLESACRGHDIATRMGGDEFAVLLRAAGRPEAIMVADRLLRLLEAPFIVVGREVIVTASVGIICVDTEITDAESLLRRADLAMYAAKSKGKNRVEMYEAGLEETVLRRLDMDNELRKGLDHGDLILHYQPLLNLVDGSMHGVEALVRWRHPTWGLVPPLDFIGPAEESGLIVRLGAWVLETACKQLAEWSRTIPHQQFSMSVNVSSRQLREPDFIAMVQRVLEETGLDPHRLVLEVTESVVVEDLAAVNRQFEPLRDHGVKIAIDDFGSGYSSLSYLRKLPCDIVKIDRAFIEGLDTSDESRKLTRAIVGLLEGLNVLTVAEGIETPAQSQYLTQLGVDIGQGYLFARPLEAAALESFVSEAPATKVS